MDELSINPDVELNTSDTTFEIEGYGDSIDAIQEAYEAEPFKEPLEEQEQEINQLAVQKQQETLGGTSQQTSTPISTQAKVREKFLLILVLKLYNQKLCSLGKLLHKEN